MIRYASFKNIKVRYSDKGHGRAVVLLHGFLESHEIWDEFSDKLSKSFRVIAIDLPGFGDTPCIGYVHSMELMAQCVKAVMDNIGYRRYVVVGHSMGGYVGLAFADLFADNVSGLCLFHSTSLPDTAEKKQSRNAVIKIVKENPRHYINAFYESLFAPANADEHKKEIQFLRTLSEKFTRQGIVNALEGMKERKKRDWILEFAKYPVLFIAGKKDNVIPYKSVLQQAQLVKHPTVLLLEDVGHMGFYEAKEETLKVVKRFAGKCFRNE